MKKTQNKKLITFTYYGPQIRRITNLFKNTNIQIAFRTTNTIQQQLNIGKVNLTHPNGIYRLQFMTCNRVYIGQTGGSINTRLKEHIRYVKYNNPESAYAMHILDNRHEFGPETEILKLQKHCTKGSRMNVWENLFIQEHHIRGPLILEQQVGEYNPLYRLANLTKLMPYSTLEDSNRQGEDRS